MKEDGMVIFSAPLSAFIWSDGENGKRKYRKTKTKNEITKTRQYKQRGKINLPRTESKSRSNKNQTSLLLK